MARMKKEDIESIVGRDMPGYRLARKGKNQTGVDAARQRPNADAGTPDLQALRRKYLSRDSQSSAGPVSSSGRVARDNRSAEANDDDEIVAVERDNASDPWDRGSRPKAVVVSGRNKRIVGKQG